MKLRNGNNSRKEYAAQIGVQGFEFAAEGPFKNGYDGSYLFNYRYSKMALIFPILPEMKNSNELLIYKDFEKIAPFKIDKSEYRNMDDWLPVENIEKVKSNNY